MRESEGYEILGPHHICRVRGHEGVRKGQRRVRGANVILGPHHLCESKGIEGGRE